MGMAPSTIKSKTIIRMVKRLMAGCSCAANEVAKVGVDGDAQVPVASVRWLTHERLAEVQGIKRPVAGVTAAGGGF